MAEPRVGVVVVAAGAGARYGAGVPKAFVTLSGRSLLARSVEAALGCPGVERVVVVAPSSHLAEAERETAEYADSGVRVVAGGVERHDSVAAGLAVLPAELDVVLVHDAARATTPSSLFAAVAAAVADGAPAVVPGLPVVDTIKQVDEAGTVMATLPRAALRAVQTPQGFRRDVLERAHAATGPGPVTDDAALVEGLGLPVLVIPGDPLAHKITTPADLDRAVAELSGRGAPLVDSGVPMPSDTSRPVAVITGGGSGIGAATAGRLHADGFDVVVTGRRQERLDTVVEVLGDRARGVVMDVTDPESVIAAAEIIGACDILINNAGGALGTDPVERGAAAEWRYMFESNVVGTLHVTQAFLPALRRSPRATVVVVTSVAAEVVYPGGAGYTAAKHAERALAETLRLELNGERVRVVEICPGMVRTEGFSLVRYHGDQNKADAVYEGVDRPLTAEDVAECIAFCVNLPQHVNIDRLVVKPVAQAAPHLLHRGPIDWHDGA